MNRLPFELNIAGVYLENTMISGRMINHERL